MVKAAVVTVSQQPLRSRPPFRSRPVGSRSWAAFFAVVWLIAVGGCAAVEVKLGTRVSLQKIPSITTMAVSLPTGPGIAPGDKLPLVATLTEADGTVLVTEGEGKGKVLWKDLTVTATVAKADKKGNVSLPKDPRVSDGKVPHVSITAPSHPDLHAELDIPVRYDRAFTASFSGISGNNGLDGMNGSDGMDGSSGSTDPDNPSPGGSGSSGTNGSDGGNGGDGGNGPPVQIRVTLRQGSHPLLQASVSAKNGKQSFFLVDPQGGSLMVKSLGGAGGSGGKGGRGGRGGAGGSGSPPGMSGSNGSDGQDGMSGSSGNGGSITVTYDPQVKPFLSAIHLSNPGGPAPVFKEEPVAALW